jgi:hypothetical protein
VHSGLNGAQSVRLAYRARIPAEFRERPKAVRAGACSGKSGTPR